MENTPSQEKEYHQWVLDIKTRLDIVIEFCQFYRVVH